jgi:hypothetical protein
VPVLYVSPSVIKFFMPADAQFRTAEVIVASQEGYIYAGSVIIGRDGSRLMTMADDDNGAAVVINSRKMTATNFDVETDENFGPDKRTRLTLFATGISGGAVNLDTSNDVTIMVLLVQILQSQFPLRHVAAMDACSRCLLNLLECRACCLDLIKSM